MLLGISFFAPKHQKIIVQAFWRHDAGFSTIFPGKLAVDRKNHIFEAA
jgi:hypothetical protein